MEGSGELVAGAIGGCSGHIGGDAGIVIALDLGETAGVFFDDGLVLWIDWVEMPVVESGGEESWLSKDFAGLGFEKMFGARGLNE